MLLPMRSQILKCFVCAFQVSIFGWMGVKVVVLYKTENSFLCYKDV